MKMRLILTIAVTMACITTQLDAKATFACRGEVEVGGLKKPSKSQAMASARSFWVNAVGAKYGASWAQLSRAEGQHYSCRGNWYCEFTAKPCGPVAPPNISARKNTNARLPSLFD